MFVLCAAGVCALRGGCPTDKAQTFTAARGRAFVATLPQELREWVDTAVLTGRGAHWDSAEQESWRTSDR